MQLPGRHHNHNNLRFKTDKPELRALNNEHEHEHDIIEENVKLEL